MLINSVAGGGGEGVPAALAFANKTGPYTNNSSTVSAILAQPGDPQALFMLRQLNRYATTPMEHAYVSGYIGHANWGWVYLNGADLWDHEVEVTFVTPETSALGAGKRIQVKCFVQATVLSDTVTEYDFYFQVVESDITEDTSGGNYLKYDLSWIDADVVED